MSNAVTKDSNEAAIINQLLATMDTWQASDVFLVEGKPPAMRIHGSVRKVDIPALTAQEINSFLTKVLLPANVKRFEEKGDLDFGYSLEPGRRFRLNLSRQQGSLSLVARALPPGELSFGELGLPQGSQDLADQPRGLMLITGATGSGKSTTLAAFIHHINTRKPYHIVSIEDPIEFVHRDIKARISQREVGTDTHSFHEALRHIVRQSPDVIVIGEMRDLETMEVALSAALTGHLVLATLHTIDVTQTLQRILSYFPAHLQAKAAMDLSLSLRGILCQRLVPRRDGKGRALAAEMLTVTPAAARLIQEQRIEDLQDYMRRSTSPGILTFNQSLLELHRRQVITYEVGLAYASNPEEYSLATQGMSTGVAMFTGDSAAGGVPGLDLKALLRHAIDTEASDLHLTVGRPPIYRRNGRLEPIEVPPLSVADMRILLYSILNVRQRTAYELERELDFALALEDGKRFRVNAYHQKGHMATSLRAIPYRIPDAAELGLPDILLELGERPHGLLLVVGPTGSGKTTTLACLIDRINNLRACRIITVEDPIEYVHTSRKATVDQRELHADTLTFAAALKNVLRQDPDVILVGEMRDLETTAAAITAAETGHLVLATLHTNDAVQTVDRIIDIFPSHQQSQVRSQVASSLVGVVSQRLLSRADGKGRVAAFEVLVATMAIRAVIRENKMHQALSLMESKRAEGMITLDQSLRSLVDNQLVTVEEAMRYVRNPRVLLELGTNASGR